MQTPLLAKILLLTMLTGCVDIEEFAKEKEADFTPSQACFEVLRSNCNATQQEMLDLLLRKLDIYGIDNRSKRYPGKPPAFDVLPKDKLGLINWVKTFEQGLIMPRASLGDEEEKSPEGFLDNLIFMQVEVHIMADVVFPHGMHTYWLSCDSCHPEPFKKVKGSNNIKMKEIIDGKWCGKCHGTVAFPPGEYSNCRRCHVLPKKSFGNKDGPRDYLFSMNSR